MHETTFPSSGTALDDNVKLASHKEWTDGKHFTVAIVMVEFDATILGIP